MGSRRSGGATGRGRRSAWALEVRMMQLDEGGGSAWIVEGRVVPLDEGESLHGQ